MPDGIYLDHAASTPLRPGVLEAMTPFLSPGGIHGNPSSSHRFGRAAKKALEEARETVAGLLHCRPKEVCFTSGGTESDNLAVHGAVGALPSQRNGILTCATEHPAVLEPCRKLGEAGVPLRILNPRPDGRVDPTELEAAITPETGFVTLMVANNETGVRHPLLDVSRICWEKDLLLHTDAVQGIGHVPFNLDTFPVDLLSLTAHKLGGPRGVGALFVRQGVTLRPLMHGGAHETGRRPGTENVAGAVGLAAALQMACAEREGGDRKLAALRTRLVEGLRKAIPDLVLHGHPTERIPHIASLSLPGVDASSLLVLLDQEGVAASGGSACHTGSAEPSAVLSAMGVPKALALSAVRLSLGHTTTEAEVDEVLGILVRCAARLKR